jgi:hypothetical protein
MTKLEQGIELVRSGDKEAARQLLAQVVTEEPNNERAWMWLAYCAKSRSERKRYLERVLEINPVNFKAAEALEKLNASIAKSAKPKQQKVRLVDILLPLLVPFVAVIIGVIFLFREETRNRGGFMIVTAIFLGGALWWVLAFLGILPF